MQFAKTGRATIEKSFRNSGEASACSSKQRYSSERQLDGGRTSLNSLQISAFMSCGLLPSDICRRYRSNALAPFDLALSLFAAEMYSARAPSQIPL